MCLGPVRESDVRSTCLHGFEEAQVLTTEGESVSIGKFGKQSLRFRAAKTFFFGITVFLYQNKNPVAHLSDGDNFVLP